MKPPDWWDWELDLTPHLEKRMEDRDFTEVDLRQMLQDARSYQEDAVEGRFIVVCPFRRNRWHVIVEPDRQEQLLVVITAYAAEE